MWGMLWPVLLVVLSNTVYHICEKSLPENVNAFAAVMVTYLVGAAACAAIAIANVGIGNLPAELRKLNSTSFILGLAIVGLEVGFAFLYRAGWKVGVGPLVCNLALSIVLIIVGVFAYGEAISVKQIIGMVLCGIGMVLVTK